MQVKLLRFLQDQIVERIGGRKPVQVDVRIVCATNQDLDSMMAEGRFREDLYYRLNELTVRVPPLRERLGDAVVPASFYLRRFASEYGRQVRGFASSALTAIQDHQWPGNVRELENRVKRAVVMADGPLVSAGDLGFPSPAAEPPSLGIRAARARRARGTAIGSCPDWRQFIKGSKAARHQPTHTLRPNAAASDWSRCVTTTGDRKESTAPG
jgi:two-component system NtrC family response regulator